MEQVELKSPTRLFSHVREDNGALALHNTDYIVNLDDISLIVRQYEKREDDTEESTNIRVTMKSGAEFCLPIAAGEDLIRDLQNLVNCTQETRKYTNEGIQ